MVPLQHLNQFLFKILFYVFWIVICTRMIQQKFACCFMAIMTYWPPIFEKLNNFLVIIIFNHFPESVQFPLGLDWNFKTSGTANARVPHFSLISPSEIGSEPQFMLPPSSLPYAMQCSLSSGPGQFCLFGQALSVSGGSF